MAHPQVGCPISKLQNGRCAASWNCRACFRPGIMATAWSTYLPIGAAEPISTRCGHGCWPPMHLLHSGSLAPLRSEEHTSELQSRGHLVCRLLLEKKKTYEHTL